MTIAIGGAGSLPDGQTLPACPADPFNVRMPLGMWQVESAHSCVLPEALYTQELLWLHWLRSRERLIGFASISDNSPPLSQYKARSGFGAHRGKGRAISGQEKSWCAMAAPILIRGLRPACALRR